MDFDEFRQRVGEVRQTQPVWFGLEADPPAEPARSFASMGVDTLPSRTCSRSSQEARGTSSAVTRALRLPSSSRYRTVARAMSSASSFALDSATSESASWTTRATAYPPRLATRRSSICSMRSRSARIDVRRARRVSRRCQRVLAIASRRAICCSSSAWKPWKTLLSGQCGAPAITLRAPAASPSSIATMAAA